MKNVINIFYQLYIIDSIFVETVFGAYNVLILLY